MKGEKISSEVLLKIKDRLRLARISWSVFAGAATSCYGSRRKITDIDILVKCEGLEKAKARGLARRLDRSCRSMC